VQIEHVGENGAAGWALENEVLDPALTSTEQSAVLCSKMLKAMNVLCRSVKTIALDKWNEMFVEVCFRSNGLEFL